MKNRKKVILIFLKVGIFLCFVGAIYPVVTQAYTHYQTQKILNSYQKDYEKASWQEKKENYDRYVKKNQDRRIDKIKAPTIPKDTANNLPSHDNLKKDKLGEILGEIRIPKIGVQLPIYDGVNDYQLSQGIGVLKGTDLPTGGLGTKSVLSGHSGIPNKRLFTDLHLLKSGDKFFLDVSGKKLAYQVDQIKTILPTEFNDLLPIEGKDYVTLMTCTPIGENTHRLLVRGVRVAFTEADIKKEKGKGNLKVKLEMDWYPIVIIGLLVIILIGYLIKKMSKIRRNS